MNRRQFFETSVGGSLGLAAAAAPEASKQQAESWRPSASGLLFPVDLPDRQWVQFQAAGFSALVVGIIHRASYPAQCGVPLGGLDTGCLDLETSGLYGLCTIFNTHVPRRGALNLPFLGLSIGRRTWVLSTGQRSAEKGTGTAVNERRPPTLFIPGARLANDIHYWGHYPVADMEFETDAPVRVALRAWAPFLPGDVDKSILPGAVFEVHLQNTSAGTQSGSLAFTFFGPDYLEAGIHRYEHKVIRRPVRGLYVTSLRSSYVLGVIGEDRVRTGGDLRLDGPAWTAIGQSLPAVSDQDPGSALAVDFSLEPNARRVVRFVLVWHSPRWMSGGTPSFGPRSFRHMYSQKYPDALAAAEVLAREHETLLRRVLAWQQAIYTDKRIPAWLREVLLNQLHTYSEVAFWAVAEPPVGNWCRPKDGLFCMNESPRASPQMECIPVTFFGNLPLVYLFPSLALSNLRAQKAYQTKDGAPPFVFGGEWSGPCEMAEPTLGYQVAMNTICYVTLVDRWRMLHRDEAFVREFYPSVKKSVEFMVDLNHGPDGLISMPDRWVSLWGGVPFETQWYEWGHWAGMVPHIGGLRIATLRMAQRMAREAGDQAFAEQCERWVKSATRSLEEKTWLGDYYLRYWDEATGDRSEDIFSAQLDGEWLARHHGFQGAFQPERLQRTLETLKNTCVAATRLGAVLYTTRDGNLATGGQLAYPATETFPMVPISMALVYMYAGQKEFGLELIRRVMHNNMCVQGYSWYGSNSYDAITGKHLTGTEYIMPLLAWGAVAAVEGKDLVEPARPGGLIALILSAARSGATESAQSPIAGT